MEIKKNVPNPLQGSDGVKYSSISQLARTVFGNINAKNRLSRELKRTGKIVNPVTEVVYKPLLEQGTCSKPELSKEDQQDLELVRQYKDVQSLPFEKYAFSYTKHDQGTRYAVA